MKMPRRSLTTMALVLLASTACARIIRTATPPAPAVAAEAIGSTLFLIGDAGSPTDNEPVLATLEQQVRAAPAQKTIVYLGDNIYPRGLPDSGARGYDEAVRRLDAQIAVALRTETRAFFIPGNHDWSYMGPEGWKAIVHQGNYINSHGRPYVTMRPLGGCPGPETVDVAPGVRLVMIDTQWWLHDFEKPRDSTSACRYYDLRETTLALDRSLASAGGRHVIVLGHHPLVSGGEHGGHLGVAEHFFPLRSIAKWLWIPVPVIGSSYAFNRVQGASNQDVRGPENVRMRRALNWVFTRRRPLVYAAGHEHNLQVFDGKTARHVLISGGGILNHTSRVYRLSNTRYAAEVSGFMRLDFLKDGRVRLGVITVDAERRATEAYSEFIR